MPGVCETGTVRPHKTKRPTIIAVVDEDSCTGCLACIPLCPVDCIEPVPREKYGTPVPPVQVRVHECIGCRICEKLCRRLVWDAFRIFPVDEFESRFGIRITHLTRPEDGSPSINALPPIAEEVAAR